MVYQFSESELAQLDRCRRAFNSFTGHRWTLNQFLSWTIQESIKEAVECFEAQIKLEGKGKGAAHVH